MYSFSMPLVCTSLGLLLFAVKLLCLKIAQVWVLVRNMTGLEKETHN